MSENVFKIIKSNLQQLFNKIINKQIILIMHMFNVLASIEIRYGKHPNNIIKWKGNICKSIVYRYYINSSFVKTKNTNGILYILNFYRT